MKNTYKIIYLVFILTIFFGNALADDSTEKSENSKMIVKKPSVAMTRTARGGKMGELYINSPVEVLKEEGDWLMVNIKTWVKKADLANEVKRNTNTSSKIIMPSKELVLDSYSTRIVKEGLPEKRVYLTLKLKNNTKVRVQDWEALLVATVKDEVVFRESLSDDNKVIEPGKTIEVNFYWEPSEKPFSYLENASPKDTLLKLYKVKLNQS